MNKFIFCSFFFLIICILFYPILTQKKSEILIFCPSSLTLPMSQAVKEYNQEAQTKVMVEYSGTQAAIRKVSDLNRDCDLLITADNTLFDILLLGKKIYWYIDIYASSLVIAYNESSKYKNIINVNNWAEILLKKDVKTGVTNPATEPAGYRTMFLLKLIDLKKYSSGVKKIYDQFKKKWTQGDFRHDVNSLVSSLEAGFFDYIFVYKSVAIQHRLNYIEFPDCINLSKMKYRDYYKKVNVNLKYNNQDIKLFGKPIIYSVSIPEISKNYKEAVKFLNFLINDKIKKKFEFYNQKCILKNNLTLFKENFKSRSLDFFMKSRK